MNESQAAPYLDDELGIPPDATLKAPSTSVQLLIIPPQDISIDFITIASPSSSSEGDATLPGSLSTHISSESSLRGAAARSLIVGRQASAADIRIDHKSVSRRHTALYYENQSDGATVVLVVHDLGGKHGTYVDDSRLEKNCRVKLPMRGNDNVQHNIRFGNAPLICRVIMPAAAKINEGQQSQPQQSLPEEHNAMEKNNPTSNESDSKGASMVADAATTMNTEANDNLPSTRETREAQIAAMIESLDTNPVYKKYIPTDDGEMEVNESTTMKNGGTNGNIKSNGKDNDNNLHNNTKPNKYNLPITSSITLSPESNSFTSSDGTNTPLQANASVSTLCFEPSGARIVAGHRDGTLRFYDFHGMQPSMSSTYPPFRIVDTDNDPLDQTGRHLLTALGPSATGGQWIVGTTSSQPKVLDREGRTTLFYFIKGDTYVTDSSATKGHTAGVTGVAFHPLVKDVCWTTGLDGSIRQWDVSGRGKTQFQKLVCQKVIGKCKNEKGQRTQVVSNLSVHPNGRKIVVGTADGSIQIWNCFGTGVNSRPLGAVYSAHGGSKPVTFVTFSGNGELIASRSDADDTVRIWNVSQMEKGSGSFGRKFSSSRGKEGGGEHPPSLLIAICKDLPALNESANLCFGPDGRMICAGTSVDPRARLSAESSSKAFGKLKFYQLPEEEKRSKASKEPGSKSSSKNKTTAVLHPVEELNVAPNASILGVLWHPKLNQIALGTSNGE